jgi:hypothetical protein
MPHTLISTHTVPDDYSGTTSSVDITSGITSSYSVYEFHLLDLHPVTNSVSISFQADVSGSTDFDQPITSTFMKSKRHESGTGNESMSYVAAYDQTLGDAYQLLCNDLGNDADQAVSGVLTLYNPSSGTYAKNFVCKTFEAHESDIHMHSYCAGYIHQADAITAVSFKFDSGSISTGVIKMYGVS